MRKKRKQIVEHIEILNYASEGKSVARLNEKVIFVEGAVPQDVVTIEITKDKKDYAEAHVRKLEKPSPDRIDHFCSHFGSCGGCKWQFLSYEKQLFYKQQQVVETLKRIGKVQIPECMPILGSQNTQYYRNRLDFTFSNRRWLTDEDIKSQEVFNRNALGFHVAKFFDKILDIEHCYLQGGLSNQIRNAVRNFAIQNPLSFFDFYEKKGFLRNLIIRNAETTGELMVLLQFFENNSEEIQKIMDFLKHEFPQITSLLYVVNPKGNETFNDLEVVVFSGKDHLTEKMEDLEFRVGAKSFYQTNSAQAYELYKVARNFAKLTGEEWVYDLYTGTGTIANFVAKNAKKVVGVDYIDMAIEDAKINANINGIKNTVFYAGDLKDILVPDFVQANGKPDVIITDPPRAGMHPDVVKQMLEIAPKRIVYVSCNPATQARDLQLFDQKYEITALQPVDMFPQTHHIENVVCLELR